MLKLKKVAFVQYPVTDIARARQFYENVLGLKIEYKNEDFHWFEYDVGGITLAVTNSVPGQVPGARGAVLAIEVHNLEESIDQLRSESVTITTEPFSTPFCRIAEVADPDGNRICLHQLVE